MDLEWIDKTPRQVEVGDRIELVSMPDDPDPIKPGSTGVVTSVDTRMDVVGVKWDNGRTLNLVLGVDSFNILNEGQSDKAIINKSMPKPTLTGKNVSKMRTKVNKDLKKNLQKSKDIKVESDQIEGGKADKLSPSDIAKKHDVPLKDIQKEIELGVEIEMEHTDDPVLAKEITLDHLTEFPDYYSNKRYGLKASEKKLEKVHENFFGGLGNAFGMKKNKDDQYDNKKLGDDLKRIMDVMKTSGFQHKDTIQRMIENFREKYSEHSRIGEMMKSLYYELDQLGELEETTGAGSSGAFSGPLFGGPQKRNESKVYRVKDLLEGTTTFNTDNTDGSGPFDGSTFVDMDGDGWMFDDVTFWEGGEIVDILAKTKNINWRDDNLNITKEDLIKRVTLSESQRIDEASVSTFVDNFKSKIGDKVDKFVELNMKMYQNIVKASDDIKSGKIKTDEEAKQNLVNVIKDIGKLTGQLAFFLIPGGGISLIAAKKAIPKLAEYLKLSIEESTTFGSVWGVNGPPVTPTFAAKDGKHIPSKKPIWKGGQIVQKIKNSGVLSEVNKVKYVEGGDYVSFDPKCVKYKNQPWCNQGAIDKPLKLSKTTSDNISEVAKKLGVSEKKVLEVVKSKLNEDKVHKLSLKDRMKIKLAGIDEDQVLYNLNNDLPIDWKGTKEGYFEYIEGKRNYSGSN